MPKRSRTDPILLAKRVFDHIEAREKNPAAVALGKLGGPKHYHQSDVQKLLDWRR